MPPVRAASSNATASVAADLDDVIGRCPARVVGLMTMPPLADDPEDSRRWFAALRELARRARPARSCRWARPRTTPSPSQEGATIVRIGTPLYAERAAIAGKRAVTA